MGLLVLLLLLVLAGGAWAARSNLLVVLVIVVLGAGIAALQGRKYYRPGARGQRGGNHDQR